MTEAVVWRLHGPRDLRAEREPLAVPGAGEIACRTLVSAVSPGTEVAAWAGLPPLRPMRAYPRVNGYCSVARVTAVGAGVEALKPGDVVASLQSHRSAFVCPASAIPACLPDDADPVACATTYLFHLGYAALLRAGLTAGHKVAVIGMGAIGLGTVALARLGGATTVALTNQDGAAAEAMGAHAVVRKDASAADAAGGADIMVVTANGWDDWRLALELARPGGTVAVLGFPGRGEAAPAFNPLDSRWLYDKQLAILGCGMVPEIEADARDLRFTLARTFPWLLERVATGELPARRLVSDVVPWDTLPEVYKRLEVREKGLVTCVLDWR